MYKIQCVNAKYIELVKFTKFSLYFPILHYPLIGPIYNVQTGYKCIKTMKNYNGKIYKTSKILICLILGAFTDYYRESSHYMHRWQLTW